MEVKGITIHNSNSDLSAKETLEKLEKTRQLNIAHYLVDDIDCLNIYPTDKMASHTGKGYDFGNRYTIAIEICKSRCDLETYLKAEANAMKLVKKLLKKYKLNENDIYFHSDFNTTKCPHRIFEIYETKRRFIDAYIQS